MTTKILKFSPNIEDQLWRANVRSEETASVAWKTKWGWILDEYEKLQKEFSEVSKKSIMFTDQEKGPPDPRTIKPFPNSVNHEYGWLAAKKEFKLDKFGSDIYKGMPFLSL